MNLIGRAGFAVGLAAVSGIASATPCDSALSSYESAVSSSDTVTAGLLLSSHPECFGASAITARTQINATSFAQAAAISRAVGLRFASDAPGPRADAGIRGMAAGGAGKKWNGWGNVANNDTRQSYRALNTFTSNQDSDIWNTVVGADYTLSPTMVLGLSAAYDKGDGSGFNTNPGNTPNNIDSHGYSIAPYLGMQLSKALVFDASFGIGRGKITSSTLTEAESDRWFAAANLGYERWMGNLQFTGKASLLHGVEKYDDAKDTQLGTLFIGTAARNTIDQLRLNVQAGYWINGFMPYAGLGYTNDVRRKTTQFGAPSNPIGRDAWVWTIGVDFFSLASGMTGGVAYRQEENRDNQKNNSLTANLSIRF